MKRSTVLSLFVPAMTVILLTASWAWAQDQKANAFYAKIVDMLKSGDASSRKIVRLVETDRTSAQQVLKILQEKSAANPQLSDSLNRLAEKVEEGLLLTEKGCKQDVADKLMMLAKNRPALTLDDRIYFLTVIAEMCPKRDDALRSLGELYIAQRQFGMAIDALNRKQKIKPDEETSKLMEMAQNQLGEYKEREGVSAGEVKSLLDKPPTLMAPVPGKLGMNVLMRQALQVKVQFDTNSDEIKPDFRTQLDIAGKEIKEAFDKDKSLALLIEGHTDTRGGEEQNFGLSERRANSVKRYLVQEYNLDQSRIKTKGYGYFRPVAPGKDESTHALNRRVEFKKAD